MIIIYTLQQLSALIVKNTPNPLKKINNCMNNFVFIIGASPLGSS